MFSNQMCLIQLQSSIWFQIGFCTELLFPSVRSSSSFAISCTSLYTSHERTLQLAIEGYRKHVFPRERLNNEFTLSMLYTRTILIGNARQLDTIRIVSSISTHWVTFYFCIFIFHSFIYNLNFNCSILFAHTRCISVNFISITIDTTPAS